jgi:hypothetical protein
VAGGAVDLDYGRVMAVATNAVAVAGSTVTFLYQPAAFDVTGVEIDAVIGNVFVWGDTDSTQAVNYVNVDSSQTPVWTPVDSDQTSDYEDVA